MDNQDYLTDYRLFFDNFYQSFEMDNPLPVHIGKYNVAEFEIVGEVVCWCLEYLNIRKCPFSLIAPLCRSVIVELEEVIRRDPESCGYRPKEDDYQTLKLMQVTIKKLNEVCLRYRDNSEVSRLPPPPPVSPSVSAAAVKNSRRTMEDCHIVIHDLHALFGIEGYGVASYYAVFDGHIGSDAALYSCSHIYQYLVESQYYPTNPEAAFKEAFIKTDERFIDKSNKENLKSGTTAVCILIRHDLGKMYVAWLGDSQAMLVNGRDYIQLVNPHRPEQLEEKERIEAMGGSVVFWGTWRVNGQLAVSRAIGDVDYKPYVTAEPDVTSYDLTGDEDFLLLACDGLWDVVSEKDAVEEVYKCLELHKGDRSSVSQSLVQAAKSLGSKDNISVVVAWLDMSTLENGHFAPGSEVDSAEDLLLPPVLRSLKPVAQTIAAPAPQRLDESAEQWLKTLPWSYADALRKPAPKREEPTIPHPPVSEPLPVPASEAPAVETKEELSPSREEIVEEVAREDAEKAVDAENPPRTSPKGDDSGDVGGEGESGDDSDEEWNYISGKENREPNQHTKQELTQEEMESQLNPNAAEFVPVYGRISPTSDNDIVDISRSPSKPSELRNLDNIVMPTPKDFYNEISKRPSEIDDLCENETTLNGGDLNNLSTKAVFGDESVCLNSAIDSSLIQNESLKSTNPFAPTQVPNFVQDHFSAPDADADLNPLNDSKGSDEYDFMVGSGKDVPLSPSEPSLKVYKGGEGELSGLSFGDGLDVDDIVRSKQDSPLLRESPEPGLHNGQAEHEQAPSKPANAIPTAEASEAAIDSSPQPPEAESSPAHSPFLPSDEMKEVVQEIVTEALLHSDHGPETSVDSESDDDVLLSPKIKERNIAAAERLADEIKPLEDPVCGFQSSNYPDMVEKTSPFETELEVEHVFHKDDEDITCPIKPKNTENAFDSVPEVSLESMQLPERASSDVTPDAPSDFEIVQENGEHFSSEMHLDTEEICSVKKLENEPELTSSPEEVKEVFQKEEVHEDLICPMKESPLLQEALKESFGFDLHGTFPESKIDEKHLENNLGLEKSVDDSAFCMKQDSADILPVPAGESETEVEETLICPLKKVNDVSSMEKDEIIQDKEDELFCPLTKNNEFVSQSKREDDIVCSIDKDEDILVCPVKKADDDLVCSINKEEILSPVKKEDDFGYPNKEESDFLNSTPPKEIEDTVCQINKKEDDIVCPNKNDEEVLVCPIKKDEEVLVCPIKKDEDVLVCPIKKDEDVLVCPIKKDEDVLVCPIKKDEDVLVCPIKKDEDVLVCPINKDEDVLVCPIKKDEEVLVCPIKKDEDDLVCPIKKEDESFYLNGKVDDDSFQITQKSEYIFSSLRNEEPLSQKEEFGGRIEIPDECYLRSDKEESVLRPHLDSPLDQMSSEPEDLVCPIQQEDACIIKPIEVSHQKLESEIHDENIQEVSYQTSSETHQNMDMFDEICSKPRTPEIFSHNNLQSPEKAAEGLLDNLETSTEDKLHQDESIDEMSSSMIDHGEDKSLPEAQSNQLDLVQDLQFNEVHEKAEADTESDSGFEIINASEASTIEMEMRVQSEKEAGAVDEKLHLDKNEAELAVKRESDVKGEAGIEPVRALEALDMKKAEEVVEKDSTPTTPPATPAPGLHLDSKEGLIAAAVAAAGVATAVAAGSAAVAVAESKPEEKKKAPITKKAEPAGKGAAGAKPLASRPAPGKPAPTAKAPAAKAPTSSAKPAAKPASPASRTAPAKPAGPASKPSTPTTKVAAKPGSKPSTPTGAKPTTPTSTTVPKSKPAVSAPTKTTVSSTASKPAAAKPAPSASAIKKPATSTAAKPAGTAAKPAVSSTVGARPGAKPAAPAAKASSTTGAKPSPAKPPTPTTAKAPSAGRPTSAKAPAPSKAPTSSAVGKAPLKAAPAKPPAAKSSAAAPLKSTSAAKPLAGKPAAPAKAATAPASKTTPAPINKKPAAPTAIKKPAAPTDKSVKEANNKLASAKTAVKKVEDKKIVNKKEEIAENEVPPTQEPIVTTTNGHITLIENGISSPEIVAE